MGKKEFVELELLRMLTACDQDIHSTEYKKINGEEFVIIYMVNAASYKICVTADSLIALVADVANFMKYK